MSRTTTKNMRKPGRPPLQDGLQTTSVSLRLTVPQREKLEKLGGPPWVRERIDKAKLPKE
ncbi:hypothetical protein [Variovorax rhizosphaerae]|uniref:Uncharacterized protein n=1 Tax=Variovorax rhizosphaerae TaxID=1836200 RepID=A0ABU8WFV8_9BURK